MADDLNLRTVQVLLRCVQSSERKFRSSASLMAFCRQYEDIGSVDRDYVNLSDDDKVKIRAILASEGIDPATQPDAWKGISRSEALQLGGNEKLTNQPVMQRRVAVKSLGVGAPLWVGDTPLQLPRGCHLDADFLELDVGRHDWIIVVENWETFERIELALPHLAFPGTSPVVVWRGAAGSIRADAMLAWINGLTHPVATFVDFDPYGLVIAATLPRLRQVIAPSVAVLKEMLKKGVRDRYLEQLATSKPFLDALDDDLIRPLWRVIENAGRALPQEIFTSSGR